MNKLDIRNLRLADFSYNLNKTRQTLSDVILQEGERSYRYSDASQKNHVWARWGNNYLTSEAQTKKTIADIGISAPSTKLI